MQMKLLPPRFARPLPLLAAALFVLLLITFARLHNGAFIPTSILPGNLQKAAEKVLDKPQRPAPNRAPVAPGQCAPELEFIRRIDLDLSDSILYTRRCVRRTPSHDFDRDAVANVSEPLISSRTAVNLTDCSVAAAAPIPCDELPLQVPLPYPARDYKHLVFGIASSYDRTRESLPAFAHWMADTGALLLGVVVNAETEKDGRVHRYDLSELEREYAAAGVNATFIAPTLKKHPKTGEPGGLRTEHHHFMLIRDLLERSGPETRWIGVLDDDTFFPSLYNLDEELARHDHSRSVWLGALTDNFNSLRNWGYMAYGGAGTLLSLPLARELEPRLERCINETTVDTGDGILRDCVYAHTHTKLTLVPHMYQHDMHGDMSGFYESGVRPLSLHHWKSWYHEPVPQMAAVSALCGDCFLARWRFLGDDALLANGYSVTAYAPGVLDAVDLTRMESTWEWPGHEYDFSFAPRREKLGPGLKKSYHLKDVDVSETLGFRQIYVYKGDWEKGERDEVVELVWEM